MARLAPADVSGTTAAATVAGREGVHEDDIHQTYLQHINELMAQCIPYWEQGGIS